MKKKVYVGLFSALLLVGSSPLVTTAEEPTDNQTSEEVVTFDSSTVKPDLGKITIIAEGTNTHETDNYSFSVPKPSELQGYKPGEVTISGYNYDEAHPDLIGGIYLDHTVKDGKYDSKLKFGVYDKGNQLEFQQGAGNMNVAEANYPGEYGLTPYIGGEMNNGGPLFDTPKGTYSAFIRLVFTNVPQPNKDGENNLVEAPKDNDLSNESSETKTENETPVKNTDTQVTADTKKSEKEFVDKVKKSGDSTEKYANNKTLPQTNQANTLLPGLMLLAFGSLTALFAKFKFSTK